MDVIAMDWEEELHQMLIAIERQARHSLVNIRIAFERQGLSLNPKFKKYFLQVANTRLEQTYDQFEISSQLHDEIFGHASVNTSRGRSIGAVNNSTHVKNEVENETSDVVEIDDSSDEEGTVGRASSSSSAREATTQTASPVGSSGSKATHNKDSGLEQSTASSALAKRNEDVNEFRIGSTVIRGRQSNAKTDPSDKGRCIGFDAVDNMVDTLADNHNDGGAYHIRMTNPVDVGGRYVTLNATSGKSAENNALMVDRRTSEDYQRNANVRSVSKQAPINKKAMVASSTPSVLTPSTGNRYKCRNCDYGTQYATNLKRHMRKHTGEKPYRCDRCGRGFTTAIQLKAHATTHTDDFPHHCKGCFRRFVLKTDKEAHEKDCRNRRYECHLCKKIVTQSKSQLKLHMRKHTGKKPFRCEICLKRFGTKKGLKYHLDNIHARITS